MSTKQSVFDASRTLAAHQTRTAEDSLTSWLAALTDGRTTASELTDAVLNAAAHTVPLGCFVSVFDAQSRRASRVAQRPDSARPLAGIPLSVKDDLFTASLKTTGGSQAFVNYVPAVDCIAVSRLRQAGAIVFAKTNLSEFAMSYHPQTQLATSPLNPWNPKCIAGASSGGAAASIAAGVGAVAIATDTGGSIRLPASFCGLLGFVPSNGRVPRASSFGSNRRLMGIGAIGRSVADIRIIMSIMSGPHQSDPETHSYCCPIRATGKSCDAFRFAYLPGITSESMPETNVADVIEHAVARLASLPRVVRSVIALDLNWVGTPFSIVSDRERFETMSEAGTLASANISGITGETRLRLANGAAVTENAYANALRERTELCAQLAEIFNEVDFLMTPTVPSIAPSLCDTVFDASYARRAYGNLSWVNFAGCPAVSIPVAHIDGLPVGLQIVAAPGTDDMLLDMAEFVLKALTGQERVPVAPQQAWAGLATPI